MLTFNRVCREISCGLFGFLGFVFFGLGSSLCSSLVTLVFLGLVLLFERLLGCLLFFHCFPWFCSTRLCCFANLYIALLILQYLALRLFISVDIFKASICHWISFMFSFEILPSLFLFCDPLDVGWFMLGLETFLHLLY